MDTPICSFVQKYVSEGNVRMHMPAHKGKGAPVNLCDITEIRGADSLYSADGIIKKSEQNAGKLFGSHTFYSTEGSSLSIRAMLYLITLYAKERGHKRIKIAAARNAHKAFVSAAALLDVDVDWLIAESPSYLCCRLCAADVAKYLDATDELPIAVYITSPDYLGNMSDVGEIARVCHERGVLLAVDNAHGAYLNFLQQSQHPIALGADVCCDSVHKTLPVLTGGAYLHVSRRAPKSFADRAKDAMALFGSTSPSYLILASLDAANKYISDGYCERLARFVASLDTLRACLLTHGYTLCGDEPMKLTIASKSYGYTGTELAQYLDTKGIVVEFADPDFAVLMPSVETNDDELARLCDALISLPRRAEIKEKAPHFALPERKMSIREAVMSDCEYLPVCECEGRVLGAVTVGCPPAVPIAASGEMIDRNTIKCFEYYGIDKCAVVKKNV